MSATTSQLEAALDALVERHSHANEAHDAALARLRREPTPDFDMLMRMLAWRRALLVQTSPVAPRGGRGCVDS